MNVRDAAEIGGADGARRGPEGGPRAAGPARAVAVATRLVAEGGAQGWIVTAVRRGWAGPRAAGAGRAVTVAAQLEAKEGAQSSVVSAMRRGWSAERREGVAGKGSADGSGI